MDGWMTSSVGRSLPVLPGLRGAASMAGRRSAAADLLLIGDERALAQAGCDDLQEEGFVVRRSAPGGMLEELRRNPPDGVIVDLASVGRQALVVWDQIHRVDADPTLIALAGPGAGPAAATAILAGAILLMPPIVPPLLRTVLERSRLARGRAGALAYYRERESQRAGLRHLLGDSVPMVRLKTQLRMLLDAELAGGTQAAPPVLLCGESGTGKELVGRALHFEGARRERPFVCVEGSELGSPLAQARLFGEAGAVGRGARLPMAGLAEAADGGTLFVRDIDLAPPAVQRRLAVLIGHGVVSRGDGAREVAIDVRVHASTRRAAAEFVHRDELCAQLRRHLAAAPLQVAPLRERHDDVWLLSQRFLQAQAARCGVAVPAVSECARTVLAGYAWPGNVRELRHALEHAFFARGGGGIDSLHLGLSAPPGPAANPGAVGGMVELRDVERAALLRALQRTRGNVSRAARLLGVTRDTMRYRMAKHALDVDSARSGVEAASM